METENKDYLVIALAKAGDFESAEKLVDELEEKAQVRILLHRASIEAHKYHRVNLDKAFKYLKEALKLDANNREVLEAMALNCEKIKDWELALKYYDKLLKLEPNNQKYLQAKAESLLALKSYNKCMEIYDKILNADSKNIEIIHAKAKLLEKMGDKQEALNYYDKLIQLSPNYPSAKEDMHKLMNRLIAYA